MTVSYEEAQQTLSELLTRVEHGETIVIERDGKAAGLLSPAPSATINARRFGSLSGRGIVPDDIKKPFEAEINELFYGK